MKAPQPIGRGVVGGLLAAATAAGRAVFETVLPQTCAACGAASVGAAGVLCASCRSTLVGLAALPSCPRCGRLRRPESIHAEHCAGCRTESFWNVGGVSLVGPYSDPVKAAILKLKFGGDARCAGLLGEWLASAMRSQAWYEQIEMLVPVPMHRLRRLQRRCDHALELAREAGLRLKLPVQQAAVRRVRYAPSQTRAISRYGRFEQVRDCFAAAPKANVRDRTVCIVDNLIVSGATVHEVSRVLRSAGAKRIYCAVVARSVLPGETQLEPAHLDSVATV